MDLAAKRKARLEQGGKQRLDFISGAAATPAPTAAVAVPAAATEAASPSRRSAFSGSPVFSSSPPPGFGGLATRAPSAAAPHAAAPAAATTVSSSSSASVPPPRRTAATDAPKPRSMLHEHRRSLSLAVGVLWALLFALVRPLWSFVVPCGACVSALLLMAWASEPSTQEALRSVRGTLSGAAGGKEKLGVVAVLLLGQLSAIRDMFRMGLDAVCVAAVLLVLLTS